MALTALTYSLSGNNDNPNYYERTAQLKAKQQIYLAIGTTEALSYIAFRPTIVNTLKGIAQKAPQTLAKIISLVRSLLTSPTTQNVSKVGVVLAVLYVLHTLFNLPEKAFMVADLVKGAVGKPLQWLVDNTPIDTWDE
ncbi:MAG: hypothetical protein ABSA17_02885 [Rhabdochlamydiaceae bacterium]|jgi:hypothetical protein